MRNTPNSEAFPDIIDSGQLEEWRKEGRVITGRDDTCAVLCGRLIQNTHKNALSLVPIAGLPGHRKSKIAKDIFNACGRTKIDGRRMHVPGDDFLGHERGSDLREGIAEKGPKNFLDHYQRVTLACEVIGEILEAALSGQAKNIYKSGIYHKEGVHSGKFAPKTYHVPSNMMVLLVEAVNALYQLDEALEPKIKSINEKREIEVIKVLMHAPVMQRLTWVAIRAVLDGKTTSFESVYTQYFKEYSLMIPLMQQCAQRADLICDMPCTWEEFAKNMTLKAYEKIEEEKAKAAGKKKKNNSIDQAEKLKQGEERLVEIFRSVPAELIDFAFQGYAPAKFKRAA